MSDIFEKYGLSRVVNVSAKETAWGAARVHPEVIGAAASILPHALDLGQLHRAASAVIAEAAGGEAGFVTGCTAAGIAVSVAACMTGLNLALVEQLPDTTGMKDEVIVQKGHECNFGARISQMIRIPGARVVEVGTATDCARFQVEGAINENTAAAVYVVSHHTVQVGQLDLAAFAEVCRAKGVPVIVDVAGEYDWPGVLEVGADLVIWSAHKTMGGLTAGVIAGRADLIGACYFNERGIGRPMKAGKEGIIGTLAALERWAGQDHAAIERNVRRRVDLARGKLAGTRGLSFEIEPDPVGQPVVRLAIHVDPGAAGLTAFDLAQGLAKGDPKIVVYSLDVERGHVLANFGQIDEPEIDLVCARIKKIVAQAKGGAGPSHPPQRHDLVLAGLHAFPGSPPNKKQKAPKRAAE